MFRSLLFVSSALAFVAAAHAQQPTSATPPTAQEDEIVVTKTVPAKKKRVCRRQVATGSIMMKTVCMTQEEEEAITAQSQATLEQMKRDQEGMANMRRANDGPEFRNARCEKTTAMIKGVCSPKGGWAVAELNAQAVLKTLRTDQRTRCGAYAWC